MFVLALQAVINIKYLLNYQLNYTQGATTTENNYSNIDNNIVQVHSRSPILVAIHARMRHRLLFVNDSDMYVCWERKEKFMERAI